MKKQLLNPGIVIVLFLFMLFLFQGPKTEPAKIPPFTFGNDFANPDLSSKLIFGSNETGEDQNHIYHKGLQALSFFSWNTRQHRGSIPDKDIAVLSGNILQTFTFQDKVTIQLYHG
jgi:hypothetical protein